MMIQPLSMTLTSANNFSSIWRHNCNQIIFTTDSEKTATRWPRATKKTAKIWFHLNDIWDWPLCGGRIKTFYLFINFQIKFSFESFRIWISFDGFTLLSATKGLVDDQTDGHGRETRLRIKQYPFLEVIASRSPAGLNSSDVIGVVPTVHFWSGLHGP